MAYAHFFAFHHSLFSRSSTSSGTASLGICRLTTANSSCPQGTRLSAACWWAVKCTTNEVLYVFSIKCIIVGISCAALGGVCSIWFAMETRNRCTHKKASGIETREETHRKALTASNEATHPACTCLTSPLPSSALIVSTSPGHRAGKSCAITPLSVLASWSAILRDGAAARRGRRWLRRASRSDAAMVGASGRRGLAPDSGRA
ncbi:unnamed protein product [Mycena citricolor]|uniref:Uncharacterized protein n=1 Tax=Mycena citricolor TaxID=2018698 RepID=A0AAD2H880_9AGAR|nr:unnamed protein product [Mycena citricolor]CAK5270651.1 unnamed protein product [Mycena citricolor]